MTWTYRIATGAFYDPEGVIVTTGYSGKAGQWRNNPSLVRDVAEGPIPPGVYQIGPAHTSPNTGPFTMDLDPLPETDTFGRSLFRIHGDNTAHDASHGCVILDRPARLRIEASTDKTLTVTA